MRKKQLFIITALVLACLSGCHKDKPVESQAPLETIQPDTTSETISDKLDEAPTLSIEEAPGVLPDDAISTQIDIETSSESDSSNNKLESKSEDESEIASSDAKVSESENEGLSVKTETISESEAQAILESEVAVRESAQDNASDWVKQNQEMESMANDYYDSISESILSQEGIEDRLNPYK